MPEAATRAKLLFDNKVFLLAISKNLRHNIPMIKIGSLVKLVRDGRLAVVHRVAVNGNIGLRPLDGLGIRGERTLPGDCLIWTYSERIELLSS